MIAIGLFNSADDIFSEDRLNFAVNSELDDSRRVSAGEGAADAAVLAFIATDNPATIQKQKAKHRNDREAMLAVII